MRGGRHLQTGENGGVELKLVHLRGGVLHRHSVRPEIDMADTAFHLGIRGIEMVGQDFFGEGEWMPGTGSHCSHTLIHCGVNVVYEFDGCCWTNGYNFISSLFFGYHCFVSL